MPIKKNRVSFTFSDDAVVLLKKLAEQYGLSNASTLEFLIREKAKALNLTVE